MTTKRLGVALAAVGFVLLGVAGVGHFTSLGDYRNVPAREWETFAPESVSEFGTWSALSAEAERRVANQVGDQNRMRALYRLVTERFTHGDTARHNLFSNWLLAGMGIVHPAFARIRGPETMVERGHSLLCGQSSYVLLRLAQENGIRARHVGLFGHVVLEAWYDGDWHLFDPDLEVVPRDSEGHVLSVEELARTPGLLEQYYGDYKSNGVPLVDILASRENNTYMSYPSGAWFEWKANILFWFEKLAEILKFVLPALLMGFGTWLIPEVGRSTALRQRSGV
jgi:hypothetical protein